MLSYVIVQLHSNRAAVATAAAATILAKLAFAVQMLWYATENTSTTTTERKTDKKQAQSHKTVL